MNTLPFGTEEAEVFDPGIIGSPEPMRSPSIELGSLPGAEDHRPITEDEGQSTANHIDPLEPGVGLQRTELRSLPTIDDVLERLHSDRPTTERQDGLAMELPR